MLSIEELREIDNQFFQLIQDNTGDIDIQISKSNFKFTSYELMRYIAELNSIKCGFFDLSETQNTYAINILYRGCIEIFLKAFYIYSMAINTKNDSIAVEFHDICQIKEYYNLAAKSPLTSNSSKKEIYQQLQELHPLFRKYTFEQFRQKENKFTYTQIIKELIKFYELKGIPSNFLRNILFQYGELSSFIHGGHIATAQTSNLFKDMKFSDDNILNKIRINLEMVMLMYIYLWELLLIIFFQNNKSKKLSKFYNEIIQNINKINKTP